MNPLHVSLSPLYSPALARGTAWACGLLILSGLMLDGGRAWRATLIALLVTLVAVAVSVTRRPQQPTWCDIKIVSWGVLPLWLLALMLLRPLL